MRALPLSERLNFYHALFSIQPFPQEHPFFQQKRKKLMQQNETNTAQTYWIYLSVKSKRNSCRGYSGAPLWHNTSAAPAIGNFRQKLHRLRNCSSALCSNLLYPSCSNCAEISLKTALSPIHYSTLLQKLTSCGCSYPLQRILFFFWWKVFGVLVPLKWCVLV